MFKQCAGARNHADRLIIISLTTQNRSCINKNIQLQTRRVV